MDTTQVSSAFQWALQTLVALDIHGAPSPEAVAQGPRLDDPTQRLTALRQQERAAQHAIERRPTLHWDAKTKLSTHFADHEAEGRGGGKETHAHSRILTASVALTMVTLGDSFEMNVCTSKGWHPNYPHEHHQIAQQHLVTHLRGSGWRSRCCHSIPIVQAIH